MINIKKGGLLFRFASVYGLMDKNTTTTTVCDIVWCITFGCIVTSFIIGLSTFFLMCILEPIALALMYLITGYFEPNVYFFNIGIHDPLLPFSILVYCIIAISYAFYFADKIVNRQKPIVNKIKRPSVTVQLIHGCYARIKDKTCVIVNIDD